MESAVGPNGVSMSANQLLSKVKPFTENLIKLFATIFPYWILAKQYASKGWTLIKPYYEKYYVPEMAECAIGLVLMFFGGQYAMTIACYTALQISGWPIIKSSWQKIQHNYQAAKEAFDKDPQAKAYVDENNDGDISTDEILHAATRFFKGTGEEKLKAITSLKAVILAVDPQEVMNGIGGIWGSLLTVIATLRSAFAKDVALGVSLGENLTKSLSKYVRPWIIQHQDKEFKQWIDFLFSTSCKMIGIGLALVLARLVSAFHSAIKGGNVVAHLSFRFLAKHKLLPAEMQDVVLRSSFLHLLRCCRMETKRMEKTIRLPRHRRLRMM
jgi:hypothetical protein